MSFEQRPNQTDEKINGNKQLTMGWWISETTGFEIQTWDSPLTPPLPPLSQKGLFGKWWFAAENSFFFFIQIV